MIILENDINKIFVYINNNQYHKQKTILLEEV